jgi:hypothetical protein
MQQRGIFSGLSFLRGRAIMVWLAVSLAWLCVVAAGVCVKAGDQVSASADLARELAQLNCNGSASPCPAPAGQYGGSQMEIIATFLTYGGDTLLPLALLPPLGAFGLGLVASLVVRRVRTARPARAPRLPVVLRQRLIRWP